MRDKMIGRKKRKGCPYGCCDPDFPGSGKKRKRINKHRVKRREAAALRKEITNED